MMNFFSQIPLSPVLGTLVAIFLNGLASLFGGFIPSPFLHRHMISFLALAAGVLVGATFFNLLPEAFEMLAHSGHSSIRMGYVACLFGFLSFYIIEVLLGSHAIGQTGHRHDHSGPLILLGDALHNFTDGLAIATSFVASPTLGMATTLTVVLHELPQEIADYTILIAQGWSKKKALGMLFLVQMTGLCGGLMGLFITGEYAAYTPYLLSYSAGGFLYVAAADLLPGLHRNQDGSSAPQRILLFLGGILIMCLLSVSLPHH